MNKGKPEPDGVDPTAYLFNERISGTKYEYYLTIVSIGLAVRSGWAWIDSDVEVLRNPLFLITIADDLPNGSRTNKTKH
jgi:hypothetical protein